jgi:hypothetical protein
MSSGDEFDDYEIGYGKPPKSGQFKKGTSGNPSRRPKKPTDSVSVLMRELDSKLTINESGQRKVITKLEGIWNQSVNKAVTGDPKLVRLVLDHLPRADESAAELQQNSPNKRDHESMSAKDLTDDELAWIIKNSPEYAAPRDSPEYAALRDVDGRKADARARKNRWSGWKIPAAQD